MSFHWSLSDSNPLKFQDSKYSGLPQQCCSLDGLHSSSYFQVPQSSYQTFSGYTKRAIYNWYHRHFQVP